MGSCVSANINRKELINVNENELLAAMDGAIPVKRLCTNGSTRSCCAYTKQGRKGVNQDCMLIWEDFEAHEDTIFCGVFDGHGPNGHHVAGEVRDTLPHLVSKVAKNSDLFNKYVGWENGFLEGYNLMDEKLKTHPHLNCAYSGTTAVTLLLQGKELFVANVGDSRAILAKSGDNGSLLVQQLTVDFKPNLPGELERIRNCKGRVFALEDEPEVARLWLPDANSPGLAMARALGDFCLKEYGLSAIPQVYHQMITEHDEFIVLATDGVWEVMSNEEVAKVVSNAKTKETAARCVVDEALKKWKRLHTFALIDDCAVVCLFLKSKLIPTHYTCISQHKYMLNEEQEICPNIQEYVPYNHNNNIKLHTMNTFAHLEGVLDPTIQFGHITSCSPSI